jgi:hypothetical protein
MTNRPLKAALLKKLGVTSQRLSQRVHAVIRQVPMSSEEAAYCIAHQEGIRLDKFLDGNMIAHVRGLVSALRPNAESATPARRKASPATSPSEIRVGGAFTITDPILPLRIISDAKETSEKVYPILYVFENSVREVIKRILSAEFGSDWWDRCASASVKRAVADRVRQEDDIPWHGSRNTHPIFYTDIKDLISVVRNQEAWPKLEPVLRSIEWFTQLINCITASRNPIAHMNPISRHDRRRLVVNFLDWNRTIKARLSLIPTSQQT